MKEDLGVTAAAVPLPQVVGLTGVAALEAEMRDRLAAKNTDIERLRAVNAELLAALEKLRTEHLEFAGYFEEEDYSAIAAADAAIAKAEGR